jgi:hypothetical protein
LLLFLVSLDPIFSGSLSHHWPALLSPPGNAFLFFFSRVGMVRHLGIQAK